MSSIGIPGLILILLVALLLFGPSKLPELGRAFGRTLREFKTGAKDLMDDEPVRKSVNNEDAQPKRIEAEQRSTRLPD